MTAAGHAVSTATAHDMPFGADNITHLKIVNIVTHINNLADKLMANRHRRTNRLLCPFVPVINMHIRSANGRFQGLNQNIINSNFRNRHIFQPQPLFRFFLDQCLHILLHIILI